VLTAHHCVDSLTADNVWVWAGITRRSEKTTANQLRVERIITPGPRMSHSMDIAILKLAQDITAPLAKPIRYATGEDAKAGLTEQGKWCAASGWGFTRPDAGLPDSLKWVESKIYKPWPNSPGVITWGAQGGNQDIGACNGDSGGPLVVRDAAGGLLLAGLGSYLSSYCGNPTQPSSYARVSAFTAWLLENGVAQPSTPVGVPIARPRSGGYSILDGLEAVAASLFDPQGRELRGHASPAGNHALLPGGLPAGAYFLRRQGDGIDLREKVRVP
jgi:secreted trypsin-like serine protease